jgi:hypothetical protein
MPGLEDVVVINGKVYGWDNDNKRYAAAQLSVLPNVPVPEEAMKQIVMKRYSLQESQNMLANNQTKEAFV